MLPPTPSSVPFVGLLCSDVGKRKRGAVGFGKRRGPLLLVGTFWCGVGALLEKPPDWGMDVATTMSGWQS